MRADKKDGRGYGGRVLIVLIGPLECDALEAGVVGHVFVFLSNRASFKLPPTGGVVDVREGFASDPAPRLSSWR